MEQTEINKALIRDVYKKIIGDRDTALVHEIIAEDYIQHNPMVKTRRSGLLESLDMLKKFPKPETHNKPFIRMFAEGNYVVLHTLVEIFGSKKLLVELFRIEDGLIAEHWDAIENIAADVDGITLIGGPVEITDLNLKEINKALVSAYNETVIRERKFDRITRFVSVDVVQHHLQVANGLDGLSGYLEHLTIEKTFRIIGEGNFVLTQSQGKINNSAHVFYDIYRIAAGKIAEHWGVKQMIPEVMAHGNGMI